MTSIQREDARVRAVEEAVERIVAAHEAAAWDAALTEVDRLVMGPSDDLRDAATCRSIANDIADLRGAR
jgi:hypothetical protein